MAWPRLGLWVGAGVLVAASPVLAQGDGTPPAIFLAQATGSQAAPAETGEPRSEMRPPAEGEALAQDAIPDAREGAGVADGASTAPLQMPFLTLDHARLFNQSRYGARLVAELGERQAELAAENRRIEAELAESEKTLTERRAAISPAEFRRLADEFNAKVERHRSEQAAKEREIYRAHERNRALFQDLANQTMAGLLRERGAFAIIAEEAIVMGFRELDITEDAIARLDELVGDGAHLPKPGEGQSTDLDPATVPAPQNVAPALPAAPEAAEDKNGALSVPGNQARDQTSD